MILVVLRPEDPVAAVDPAPDARRSGAAHRSARSAFGMSAMTTIADIMTRSIATVRRDETLPGRRPRMLEMDIGALPVLDGKAIAGMVTDRDITVRGVAAGMIPQEALVADVMTERGPVLPRRRQRREGPGGDGRPAGAAPAGARRQQRDRRHRRPGRPGHATIGRHRRNSARDLDARSLNRTYAKALQRLPGESA